MTDLRDRARGVMLGLAVGDALGAQVEFMARDTFPLQTDLTGGGPHRLDPGVWTDDTSMALALAEVSEAGGSPADVLDAWTRWWSEGDYSPAGECVDVGNRTAAALRHWKEFGVPLPTDAEPFADGNGAVMRVAPLAILHLRRPKALAAEARGQALLTHGHVAAAVSVEIAACLARLLVGVATHRVQAMITSTMLVSRGVRGARFLTRETVRSDGTAVGCAEGALWCLYNARSAEECITLAANLGDDADTVAAVAGALAGAHWGASALPARWTDRVAWRPRLEAAADALLDMSEGGK